MRVCCDRLFPASALGIRRRRVSCDEASSASSARMLIASPRRHVACGASEYRSDASKARCRRRPPRRSRRRSQRPARARPGRCWSRSACPRRRPRVGTEARLLRAIEPLGERTGLPRAAPRWNEPSSDRSSSDSTTLSRRASAESAAVGRSLSVGPKAFGPKDVGTSPGPDPAVRGRVPRGVEKSAAAAHAPAADGRAGEPGGPRREHLAAHAPCARRCARRGNARATPRGASRLSTALRTRFTSWPRHITTSPSDRMCRWPPIMPAGHSRPPFSGDDCTASRFTSCSR